MKPSCEKGELVMKPSCEKCYFWAGEGFRAYKCYAEGCPAKERDSDRLERAISARKARVAERRKSRIKTKGDTE